jgi:PAS domain S-box-containing protein
MTLRLRFASLFGALIVAQGVAIALLFDRPWAAVATASAALAAAWLVTDRLVLGMLSRLAESWRPQGAGDDSDPARADEASFERAPQRGPNDRAAARHDELGILVHSYETLAASHQIQQSLLREAEQAVQHNEARYRALFDANPHPMIVFDTEGLEILAANDLAVTRYGFSRRQFLRMTVRHLFPEPSTQGVTAVLERMGLDEERPVETYHRRRDGTVVAVEVASHRITFEGKVAALAMMTDITLRKQVEAENMRRTEAVQALYDSAREQAQSLSLGEVAGQVARAAVQRFGASAAWLARTNEDGTLDILAASPAGTSVRAQATEARAHPWTEGGPDVSACREITLPLGTRDGAFGVLYVSVCLHACRRPAWDRRGPGGPRELLGSGRGSPAQRRPA